MKLKRIYPTRAASTAKFIGITKSGSFNFSFGLSDHLKLEEGQTAVFFQDEIDPKRWFLAIGMNGDYPLRTKDKSKGRTNFTFSSSSLRDKIFSSHFYGDFTSIRLNVASQPIEVEGKDLYELKLQS